MIILFTSIESWELGDLYQLTAEDNISQVLLCKTDGTHISSYVVLQIFQVRRPIDIDYLLNIPLKKVVSII